MALCLCACVCVVLWPFYDVNMFVTQNSSGLIASTVDSFVKTSSCCLKRPKALLLFPHLVLHMEILLLVTRQLKLRGDKYSDFEDEQHLGVSGLQSTRVDGKLGSLPNKCK